MKKLLLFTLFSVVSFFAFSQSHENAWINYNQEYFKIKVWQNGIYRITPSTLALAGFSTNIDPRKIQVYKNGIEQFIYVEGESDGILNNNDFIEFYGERNDGALDNRLYDSSSWQPTPRYSLYTDTAIYFLSFNPIANGKRVSLQTDTSFSSYSPASYFLKETYIEGSNLNPGIFGYNRGFKDQSVSYTMSEGWGTVFGNYSGSTHAENVSIPTNHVYNGGPNAEISMCFGGVNNQPHNIHITFPGINFQDTYFYQDLKKYNFSLSTASLVSPTSNLMMTSTTPPSTPDYSLFYWITVKYPHTYNLEGQNNFRMFVPDAVGLKTKMEISNFNGGGSDAIIYDLTNHRRIIAKSNGSQYLALVDNDGSSSSKECFMISQSAIQFPSVSKIRYITNSPGQFNDFGALAVDSAYIIITHKSLWNEAGSYLSYRNSKAPNINRCVMVDIEELYDQFAFGIQKHPLSIKNFSRYILDTWPSEAQHIFLIGKSMSPFDFRHNPSVFASCLVASYGVPTSDILLTSGINGSQWEPKIPIGRLSASKGSEVISYLNKVQEYEAAQAGSPQPWMKEILHFGGGNDINQQNLLAGYLNDYKNIMEDSSFGGHVTTYLKFSAAPIVANLSDTLQAQIDSGVAVMTFFGHASGSGFDASTDEPSQYNNRGRYPVVIANSCFAGDFHTSQKSVSEKFVLEPEKAAIAFLASVGLGTPYYLAIYTNALFKHASYYNYGATIGQLMKHAIQQIQVTLNDGEKQVSEEMSLQGDPALKLNSFSKPDYAIDESSISFSPSTISTDLDTFNVHINIRNFGKAVPDSFTVKVKHTLPGGIDSVYTIKRGMCYYSDKLDVKLHTGGFSGAGVNKLSVEIDLPDSVDEYQNLSNNIASTDFFIISKDIIPVYPPDYAVYPQNTVTLKASTANPMAGLHTYRFEIDTLDLNLKDITPGAQPSPLFRFTMITDSGGVISWNVPAYTLQDSVVYFWRVANDSIQYDTVNFHWQQSSFMYVPNKTGWAQNHFHQFKNNNYENVRYDTLSRQFKFVNNNKSLLVRTMGTPDGSQTQYNLIGYYMNNTPIEYNGCQTTPAVMVAILDSISIEPWTTCDHNFGQANWFSPTGLCNGASTPGSGPCRSRPENYFIFRLNDAVQMDSLNALINRVPNNNYIVMYSWYTYPYSTASPSFYSAITSLGFNTGFLQDNLPFIYFVKKGDLSTRDAKYGSNPGDTLLLSAQLQSIWNKGNMNSTIAGPASRWESLHWNQHPWETQPLRDTIFLNIYGLNSTTNDWDLLAPGVKYDSGKDTSLHWISASTYPYLKMQSYLRDDSLKTPPQMNYWRIYFDEVPECAVNPNKLFSFYKNPLQEGDTLRLSIGIENISNLPMDSLGVTFYMYDQNRTKHELITYKLDSLREGQLLAANIVIDTTFGYPGQNSIWMEVNPFTPPFHQPEKFHFNNYAEIKFDVERDKVNPILDVTFDNVHILNGDIVSGKPEIAIQLHDNNRFLALNDTTKFKVYITTPNSSVKQQIEWNSPMFGQVMRFTPASLPKNSCRIDWNPTLTEDGIYYLEVDARDRSNNESGKFNYKISFEVVNHSTITEVVNYPNPFSTSTRFVFTLTGSEIPTGMKIQIITVTGKIVREILQNELGNIHVGRNITDYAWDGKDEYGDQLANGLYLYRLSTDLNGKEIEHRETEIDKYFKKGWGKMYLLR